jgi:enoyl-CoA hydratase/carnithine racemase
MLQTYAEIRVERDGTTAIVTMARPEKRNALSLPMMRELTAAFRALGEDRSVRAVILAGGERAFSAGHDLKEVRAADEVQLNAIFDQCVTLMETIGNIPQPVIAEVAAIATAAGCQLVAACDLAISSENAQFATPGVRIGLFCSTPMVPLSRNVGRKRAMQMLLTGDPIDASTAHASGLVNAVVSLSDLRDTTLALAARIADASRAVVGLGKAAFYRQLELDEAAAYAFTKRVMVENAQLDDAREGISAFIDKRPPSWTP